METKRFRLEGASLPELQARVRAEHGDAARIVSAERVTVGGVRGFFARRHIEATVEIATSDASGDRPGQSPGPAATIRPRGRAAHVQDGLTTRLGIIALLDAADEAEAQLAAGDTAPAGPGRWSRSEASAEGVTVSGPRDVPSTASPDFARLMDELTFATSAAPASASTKPVRAAVEPFPRALPSRGPDSEPESIADEIPPVLTPGHPGVAAGPGDLVLLVGPAADVAEAARLMSAGRDAPVLAGLEQPGDRRAAFAARARGVETGRSVLVACEVPCGVDPAMTVAVAAIWAGVGADQVWVVVDAGRKAADTERWVRDIGEVIGIDAVAVVGIERSGTPGTVRRLGLPIGWLAPAADPAGRAPAARRFAAGPPNPFAVG